MILRTATLLCLVALVGCASSPGAAERTVTIPSADGDRSALVHRPATAADGAPLVIVLHGASRSGASAKAEFGWDALADREGFVVAYPDGIEATWNAGGCCGAARDRGVDDVGFLGALTRRLADEDGIDPRRVYAVGFSNGAMLAYAWACARSDELAGIGPVAGALLVDCPAPSPLPVVAVHGTADDRVPFAGEPRIPSVDESLAPFLAAAGCAAAPEVTGEVGTWTCRTGTVVRQVIEGGGHTWPDGTAEFLWSHLT